MRQRIRTTAGAAGVGALLVVAGFTNAGTAAASVTPPTASTTTNLATFPDSARVDLGTPTFTHPTLITNPLFPARLKQVVQLGHAADTSLHQEVTLLPYTTVITLNGHGIRTVTSQFIAYQDGRILEVAVDHFAQADDGAVWYFGEDVSKYENGVVVSHEGTWQAGKDGPPGMIMPAHPHVGDVYRPENIPGLVFEETIVKSVGVTVAGPRGPVTGAILVEEHPADGAIESKYYAPGYGEFKTVVVSEQEYVDTAITVPIDALPGGVPEPLASMSAAATEIFRSVPSSRWERVSASLRSMTSEWKDYRDGDVPALLRGQLSQELEALGLAVRARDGGATRQAVVNVSLALLDLELQFRSANANDHARLGIWERQLVLDASAGDAAAVAGDQATRTAIRNRIDS